MEIRGHRPRLRRPKQIPNGSRSRSKALGETRSGRQRTSSPSAMRQVLSIRSPAAEYLCHSRAQRCWRARSRMAEAIFRIRRVSTKKTSRTGFEAASEYAGYCVTRRFIPRSQLRRFRYWESAKQHENSSQNEPAADISAKINGTVAKTNDSACLNRRFTIKPTKHFRSCKRLSADTVKRNQHNPRTISITVRSPPQVDFAAGKQQVSLV